MKTINLIDQHRDGPQNFVFSSFQMERGENKRPWKMIDAGGKERNEAHSQRSFFGCLFLWLRTRTEEPLCITPGLRDVGWPKKVAIWGPSFDCHVGPHRGRTGINRINQEPRVVYSGSCRRRWLDCLTNGLAGKENLLFMDCPGPLDQQGCLASGSYPLEQRRERNCR